MIPLDRIEAARAQVAPRVRRTPLVPVADGRSWLKLECFQSTGSFKVRGFFAAALALGTERLAKGLLTISAGNAAQGAAYVARQLGVSCRTVMPANASEAKVEGVRRLGATPVLLPRPEFLAWIAQRGWEQEPETFIHPFTDENVIAGHGTLGLELLDDVPDLERVLVPVGGGGLIAGVGSAIKGKRPTVEVIGVQSDGYPLWPRVFAAGGPVPLVPDTIADGTTAPYDPVMFDRLRAVVDRWIVVPEPRLRAAIPELALSAKVVAEGAGALVYAALDQLPPGPVTAALVSGGNIARGLLAELMSQV
jgi:threonine dehydratase